jgi:hypothetical protein
MAVILVELLVPKEMTQSVSWFVDRVTIVSVNPDTSLKTPRGRDVSKKKNVLPLRIDFRHFVVRGKRFAPVNLFDSLLFLVMLQ